MSAYSQRSRTPTLRIYLYMLRTFKVFLISKLVSTIQSNLDATPEREQKRFLEGVFGEFFGFNNNTLCDIFPPRISTKNRFEYVPFLAILTCRLFSFRILQEELIAVSYP